MLSILRFTFARPFELALYFLKNFPRRLIDGERLKLQGCFGGRRCEVTLLTSLAGAIYALDGCIVNISGVTFFNNTSRVWELREKVERACDLRFSMIKG